MKDYTRPWAAGFKFTLRIFFESICQFRSLQRGNCTEAGQKLWLNLKTGWIFAVCLYSSSFPHYQFEKPVELLNSAGCISHWVHWYGSAGNTSCSGWLKLIKFRFIPILTSLYEKIAIFERDGIQKGQKCEDFLGIQLILSKVLRPYPRKLSQISMYGSPWKQTLSQLYDGEATILILLIRFASKLELSFNTRNSQLIEKLAIGTIWNMFYNAAWYFTLQPVSLRQ